MKKLLLVIIPLLAACGTTQVVERVVTATPEPATATPAATATPEPTATPQYGGFSAYECQQAWYDANRGEDYDPELLVSVILNENWAPDSIGYALQHCINGGWDGWRDDGTSANAPDCSMDPEYCVDG